MREAHELALREWVALGTGLPDNRVIFASQSGAGPRPTKPYATVLILSEVMSDPENVTTDNPLGSGVEMIQCSSVIGTLSVQTYSDHSEHRTLMADLVMSLRTPSITEFFQTSGVSVTQAGSGGFSDDPEELSTSYEPRTQRDFIFTFGRVRSVEVQPLESASVAGTVV